jgi:lipopolysaccharide heptosyltransferase I
MPIPEAPPERVLVVRLSALGDVLFALPALRRLREALPRARLTFLVEDRFADLLRDHPDVDELLVFERKKIARLDAIEASRLVRELRRRRFDAALDFQGNLKSGVLVRLSGARRRVGFAPPASREGNRFFSNRRVTLPEGTRWRPLRDLALLRGLGIEPGADPPRPTPPRLGPDAEIFGQKADAAVAGHGPLVVLHPGTSAFGAFKRWPPERFGEVARALVERAHARVLVTHGPGEESLALEVAALAASPSVAASPRTRSLRELAAILARAALVVGADTGPVHVAAALGRPVVAVFGPKDPEVYRPLGERTRVVRRGDVACSPCRLRYCPRPDCLLGLDAGRVLDAALDLLASGS